MSLLTPRKAIGRALLLASSTAIAVCSLGCDLPPPPSALPSPSIRATAGSSATAAPAATVDPAAIEVHLLEARFAPGDAPVSTGDEILWTAGGDFLSEIWRYVPGAAAPDRIFASPRARSTIAAVVGSSSGYAFVESSRPEFGEGGWRIWYLAAAGGEPIELDRGVAKWAQQMPTIAMDETRIAWAGFDEPAGASYEEALDQGVTRLAFAAVAALARTTTLLEEPVSKRLLWYPALHGDDLWYGVILPANDETGVANHYHIETIDLARPGAAPILFAGAGNDFNPALNDRALVWKTNKIGDAALNWGTLNVLDSATQTVRTIPVEYANRPSIGDRFITFAQIYGATLPLYDPVGDTLYDLAAQVPDAGGAAKFYGENISGRLLTFGVGARIGWAILPE